VSLPGNYFLFTNTIRLDRVKLVAFLCNLIARNESCDRNSPFSHEAKVEMFQMAHFALMLFLAEILPRYLLTITSFTLIGYYLHHVMINIYRFLSGETKQKPRNSSKILYYASYFQLSCRCLEMLLNTVFRSWYITSSLLYLRPAVPESALLSVKINHAIFIRLIFTVTLLLFASLYFVLVIKIIIDLWCVSLFSWTQHISVVSSTLSASKEQ